MAKAKKTAEAPVETADVTPAVGDDAPAPPKRSKVKIFAIGGLALTLCLGGGGYFAVPMALAMFAPSEGGAEAHEAAAEPAEEGAGGGSHGGGSATGALPPALAVVKLVIPEKAASDYQIVSIYDGEAFLATSDTVIRVKVGSTAPGLGDILAIEPSDTGGIVTGTLATLKTS